MVYGWYSSIVNGLMKQLVTGLTFFNAWPKSIYLHVFLTGYVPLKLGFWQGQRHNENDNCPVEPALFSFASLLYLCISINVLLIY